MEFGKNIKMSRKNQGTQISQVVSHDQKLKKYNTTLDYKTNDTPITFNLNDLKKK